MSEIRQRFRELKDYIANPVAYENYHSTTRDGMARFIDALENDCLAQLNVAPQPTVQPSLSARELVEKIRDSRPTGDYGCNAWVYPSDEAASLIDQAIEDAAKEQRAAKNGAYRERSQVVAALSKCFPSFLMPHTGEDWGPQWKWVVAIELPAGQVTWHVPEDEIHFFDHLPRKEESVWDGHDTDEKYRRVNALAANPYKEAFEELIERLQVQVGVFDGRVAVHVQTSQGVWAREEIRAPLTRALLTQKEKSDD